MRPFEDMQLSDYLGKRATQIDEYIEKWITNDEIMSNDLELLANNIYEQYYVIPIVLGDEDESGAPRLAKTAGFFGTVLSYAFGLIMLLFGMYLCFGKKNEKK